MIKSILEEVSMSKEKKNTRDELLRKGGKTVHEFKDIILSIMLGKDLS